MQKLIKFSALIIVFFCAALLIQPSLEAKKKNKKSHGSEVSSTSQSTPPGWSKGKKTGWRGGKYPPGWSKWSAKKKAKWQSDRQNAHTDIERVVVTYHIPQRKGDEILSAFDEAILGGLLINDAKNRVVAALKDKEQRKALMIDTTQSVLELLR